MITTYYPPNPSRVDKKLTKLPLSYQLKAVLAILSVLLFFFLYGAMVAALGYLLYCALIYDIGTLNKLSIFLKLGAVAGTAMLFVFALKFIFKLKAHTPRNRIALRKESHPKLWEFVHQICKDTGAPRPKTIFVDPDVNAYVSYSNPWLSLFLPIRKDLTIGLGLVDCLDLSEFKAVMSHEFGHFAQRSMKIGSYIMSANAIIHDMIFSRDRWDRILGQWRNSDLRLSAAAWLITPVIWIIRQLLNLFYQFLNRMYSLLSREMEFNADKVAVSTSGSDAIISALWKLEDGATCWDSTLNHAYLAARSESYVKNLYAHNARALARGAAEQKKRWAHLPMDMKGRKVYFSQAETSKVSMYASHPSNDKRERNAKTPYMECEKDPRSPWILFGEKEILQEKMTHLVYQRYLDKEPKVYIATEQFEAFIQAETENKTLSEAYGNAFENRFTHIPEQAELERECRKWKVTGAAVLMELHNELKALMEPVNELEGLMVRAQEIARGVTKEKTFHIHGITYGKKNLQQGFDYLLSEREKLFNETFAAWDTSFFSFHYALAKNLGEEEQLLKQYLQHRRITKMYGTIAGTKDMILQKVADVEGSGDVKQEDVDALTQTIKEIIVALNEMLNELDGRSFVPMPNIATTQELKNAVVDGGTFQQESGRIFENGGFDRIMSALENAIVHCQRIEQKSIGCILKLHKELQERSGLDGEESL